MIEIAICDDQKVFRNDLKEIISTELQLKGIEYTLGEFKSGEELAESVKENEKRIIFLDIEMGEMDGMETAKRIRKETRDSVIIFVTSYSEYVFSGYEVRALNYILKPYQREKIKEVLHQALKELEVTDERYYVIEQRQGITRVPLQIIKYILSDKRMVTLVTSESSYDFYGKLDEIAIELPEFVRIHNRYLVNLSYVETVGTNYAVVAGEELPVSRSCKQELSVAFARQMLKK